MSCKMLLMVSLYLTSSSTTASSLLAPAALDHLAPDLGEVQTHDSVTRGLFAVISHKCVALVLEVSHFQNSSKLIKCSPQRPLIPRGASAHVHSAVVGTGRVEHLVKVQVLATAPRAEGRTPCH